MAITPLPDGRVLVAGGQDGLFLDTAELFNPATGTWTLTGNFRTPLGGHRALLLQSGKVLVVGGTTNGFAGFSRAQLYDPTTGTWSFTGRQIALRDFPGANLLANGLVLMTGGLLFFDAPTAENDTYRPSTAAWAATGRLNTPRWDHTATLLPNGQVLIAGGAGQDQQIASAELGTPSPYGRPVAADSNGRGRKNQARGGGIGRRSVRVAILVPGQALGQENILRLPGAGRTFS